MNLQNIKKLADTPREITSELKELVTPIHPVYQFGWRLSALSVLVLLGGVIAAALNFINWFMLVYPAGALVLGIILTQVSKSTAQRNGEQRLAKAPICLAAIVQANQELYNPDNQSMYPAVVVYSTAPEHMLDVQWMQEMSSKLAGLRSATPTNAAEEMVLQQLNNEMSRFYNEQLPAELTGDSDTYWSVENINQSDLPNHVVPEEGVLPYFLHPLPGGKYTLGKIVPKSFWE